jgi:hypothetical protein
VKTPQDFRREDIKQLFDKILKEDKTELIPKSISMSETWDSDVTIVSFSFDLVSGGNKKTYDFIDVQGKGFVDAVFTHCHEKLVEEYDSIKNLSLVDLQVKPIFSMSRKKTGTDAKTDVIFRLEIRNQGMSEFSCQSRSVVHASLQAMMDAFQFYVNCDRCFRKLKLFLANANERNRGDISQGILTDMAKLTAVNNYA